MQDWGLLIGWKWKDACTTHTEFRKFRRIHTCVIFFIVLINTSSNLHPYHLHHKKHKKENKQVTLNDKTKYTLKLTQ